MPILTQEVQVVCEFAVLNKLPSDVCNAGPGTSLSNKARELQYSPSLFMGIVVNI